MIRTALVVVGLHLLAACTGATHTAAIPASPHVTTAGAAAAPRPAVIPRTAAASSCPGICSKCGSCLDNCFELPPGYKSKAKSGTSLKMLGVGDEAVGADLPDDRPPGATGGSSAPGARKTCQQVCAVVCSVCSRCATAGVTPSPGGESFQCEFFCGDIAQQCAIEIGCDSSIVKQDCNTVCWGFGL